MTMRELKVEAELKKNIEVKSDNKFNDVEFYESDVKLDNLLKNKEFKQIDDVEDRTNQFYHLRKKFSELVTYGLIIA